MPDWTRVRLNLRYHWKALMLVGLALGAALLILLFGA